MTRREGGDRNLPLELHGSPYALVVQQIIEVVDDSERGRGLRCATQSYTYRLIGDDGENLIRWENLRTRPVDDYAYPLSHVHLHATFDDGSDSTGLHVPTMRLPLELVLWHLICEPRWGVEPKTDDWQALLRESIDGFRKRQTNY